MSAAGRGAARAPFDYYPTPPWVVDRLLDRHGLELLYRDIRILEPSDSSVYAWFCWGADLGGRAIEVLDGTPLNERRAHQQILPTGIHQFGLFKEGKTNIMARKQTEIPGTERFYDEAISSLVDEFRDLKSELKETKRRLDSGTEQLDRAMADAGIREYMDPDSRALVIVSQSRKLSVSTLPLPLDRAPAADER